MKKVLITILILGITQVCVAAVVKNSECTGPYKGKKLGVDITEADLKVILENHKIWFDEYSTASERLRKKLLKDPRRANLCGAILNGVNLKGAVLYSANLERIHLHNANLEGAKLGNANLINASLGEVNLINAHLAGAKLAGADIYNANLEKSYLYKTDLRRANLRNANLDGAVIYEANLEGADLYHANLQDASLIDSNLKSAHLNNANMKSATLKRAILKDSQLVKAILQGADLRGTNLENAKAYAANMESVNLEAANLVHADLRYVNLQSATLNRANLKDADLTLTNLKFTKLLNTNFENAILNYAQLEDAKLAYANLSGASFWGGDLEGANLSSTKLNDVTFGRANLGGVMFEPDSNTIPHATAFIETKNLMRMRYQTSPHGLIALRNIFKESGWRQQERDITYAIKRSERLKLLQVQSIGSSLENIFLLVMFEKTTEWGRAPSRALQLLGGFILIFSFFYLSALQAPDRSNGIWRIRPKQDDRILDEDKPTKELVPFIGFWNSIPFALYFSLLSAFNIGWRDLNFGNWLARIQMTEYTIRATGWVRTVSGIQSLLSVYLLAIWVLTYFGRPFA